MRSRIRSLATTACLGVLAVAMAGCLDATSKLSVDTNKDTVTGSIHLEIDKPGIDAIVTLKIFPNAKTDKAVFKAIVGQIFWLPQDTEIKTKVVRGTTVYFTDIKYDAVPLAEFNHDEGMRFQHTGNTLTFTLPLDPAIYSRGIDQGQAAAGLSSANLDLAITMPGQIGETNGSVSGQTVTWKLPGCKVFQKDCVPRPERLRAVSTLPEPSPSPTLSPSQSPSLETSLAGGGQQDSDSQPPWIMIGAVLVAAAILTLVLVLVWRGRASKE